MANNVVELVAVYQDVNGDRAQMRIPHLLADTTTLAGLSTLVNLYRTAIGAPGTTTNAAEVSWTASVLIQQSTSLAPVDAEFPSVVDKARSVFQSGNGERTAISLPAPIETCFHIPPADSTVNPAGAESAFFAVVVANAKSKSGSLYALNIGGIRKGARPRRRAQHRL